MLGDTLKLNDDEKKNIQNYYLADGEALQGILNDGSLSPIQQAKEVSDLRDSRNARIEALFQDVDRRQAFHRVEAKYRVALTELAADGGLVAAPPPAPAPATNAPAPAEKAPNDKDKGPAK